MRTSPFVFFKNICYDIKKVSQEDDGGSKWELIQSGMRQKKR